MVAAPARACDGLENSGDAGLNAIYVGPAEGVRLLNTVTAHQLFSACTAHGGVVWDHSAILRDQELMANPTVSGE